MDREWPVIILKNEILADAIRDRMISPQGPHWPFPVVPIDPGGQS